MERPLPDLRTQPQCFCSSSLFWRLGSHPSPGAQGLSAGDSVMPDDRLSMFSLWPRKVTWKAGVSPLLYSLRFTKAGTGSKMAYRELIFCKVVLLTEGRTGREDNPMTLSFEAANKKEEVRWICKHKATSFSSVACCKCLSLALILRVVLGKGAVIKSLTVSLLHPNRVNLWLLWESDSQCRRREDAPTIPPLSPLQQAWCMLILREQVKRHLGCISPI